MQAALRLTPPPPPRQGTLYPDVIESCPPPGKGQKHSHTIKSHHNVGGLPEDLQFELIEPLRELFKVCASSVLPFQQLPVLPGDDCMGLGTRRWGACRMTWRSGSSASWSRWVDAGQAVRSARMDALLAA